MPAELCFLTLTELADRLRRKEVSPVEVLQAQLGQIEARESTLHAFVTVLSEQAHVAAQAAESEILAGRYRGALHGVPVAVKDLCFTRGVRTTCGSRVLASFVPDRDAHVVRRLAEAGAILVGKLALTEFAMTGYPDGITPPVNPWDASRNTGMSSSGSAVATSAGLAFATIGTDTGGSIRFPSAACGVVGLKPTYGRVSRAGVFPLAASLDHVGPLTRSVADAAAVLDAIAGYDADDPTTLRGPGPSCAAALTGDAKGIRIGVDEAYATTMTQPEVVDAFHVALKKLAQTGATIVPVKVPAVSDLLAAWPVVCAAEAVVGHAGLFPERSTEYGVMFRSMLQWGAALSGAAVARATMARAHWVGRFAGVFEQVDVLACPSASTVALPVSLMPPDAPFTPEIAPFMRFTAPMNFSGSPTLSLPFGDGALPDSLQLVGRHREEAVLCRVGQAFEQVAGRARRPPLA